MSRLLIRGGNRLQGEVTIQGAKNSVLPILAATILTGGSVELRRCPRLRDVEASIRILQALGCKAGWRGDVLEVDTAGMTGCDVPDALMREMRSSVIFLGAILARCGEASLTSPGVTVPVKRQPWARVQYYDLDGELWEIEGDGLLGRCLQHEIDHLNGKTLFESCDPVTRIEALRAYEEAKAAGARPGDTDIEVK